MSHKNKNKFKKRIKSQILQEMAQSQSQSPQPKSVFQPSSVNTQKEIVEQPEIKAEIIAPAPVAAEEKTEALDYTKYDLKKSAVIIGSIFVIIIGLYIADNKTGIILRLSNTIFGALNINL